MVMETNKNSLVFFSREKHSCIYACVALDKVGTCLDGTLQVLRNSSVELSTALTIEENAKSREF